MRISRRFCLAVVHVILLFILSSCGLEGENEISPVPTSRNQVLPLSPNSPTTNITTKSAKSTYTLSPESTPAHLIAITPPFPSSNTVAYIAYENGTMSVGILENGNKRSMLASGCIFCNSLSWSPDKKWLAFNGVFKIGNTSQIYAVNIDNGEIKQITSGPKEKFGVDWSPDGKQLVYVEEGDPTDLVVVNFATGASNKITNSLGYEIYPVWSPNGEKIAFLYREERSTNFSELWIMDADGNNRQILTNAPISFNSISWSPDGKEIVFISNDKCGKLMVINVENGKSNPIGNVSICAKNPYWTSVNNYIIFISSEKNPQIFIIRSDGKGLSQITSFYNWVPIISISEPLP